MELTGPSVVTMYSFIALERKSTASRNRENSQPLEVVAS
jgi:hypothetical protein